LLSGASKIFLSGLASLPYPHLLRPIIEVLVFALLFVIAAFFGRSWAARPFEWVEGVFSGMASRRRLLLAAIFFGVIAVRLGVLPLLPVPVPGIHDEYSYLLLGDTLAHGRMANPTHPMWISFETFHVNWFPTYSSIYPPAQGVVLAAGELLGLPWIGVLLSAAAMCAAIAWMLQAWMPARWALLGGIIAALKFGVASYWVNSYWGGCAAAIGGALVLGAVGRLARKPQVRDAVILGVGVAILANSRPYEGMIFCIPVALWFCWWLAGKTRRAPTREVRGKILLPLVAVLAITAVTMGFYNWRLTGNALLMPHTLRTRTFHSSALFLWEQPRPALHYNNEQFEDFYNRWERENYRNTWRDVRRVSLEKMKRGGHTYLWWGAILLAPGFFFALRDKKIRLLMITALLGALAVFSVIWSFGHYAAPFTCIIVALAVQSMRHLRALRVGDWPLGKWLARACVVLLAIETGGYVVHRECDPHTWTCKGDVSRAAIQEKLARMPGKHLILVRYEPEEHNIHDEWVSNGAEIDAAKVLWARELDADQNAALLDYFQDRQAWLVEPDTDNTELIPYAPRSE
jgi:hypothetical protein